MRAIRGAPNSKRRLGNGGEFRWFDIWSKPALDQRGKAEISTVRHAIASLAKKSIDAFRMANSVGVPGLCRHRPRAIHQLLAGIGSCKIAVRIDDLAGPDPFLRPVEGLHQNKVADQFGVLPRDD